MSSKGMTSTSQVNIDTRGSMWEFNEFGIVERGCGFDRNYCGVWRYLCRRARLTLATTASSDRGRSENSCLPTPTETRSSACPLRWSTGRTCRRTPKNISFFYKSTIYCRNSKSRMGLVFTRVSNFFCWTPWFLVSAIYSELETWRVSTLFRRHKILPVSLYVLEMR